jgi:opacity protein-like surface antigen
MPEGKLMRCLICVLLLAAWAAAGTRLAPATPTSEPSPRELAVDRFVEDARAPMVLAPASGGLLGWIALRVDAWYPRLDGHFSDTGGDIIDAAELNLDTNTWGPGAELTLTPSRFFFRFDFYQVSFEGDTTLSRTFTFGGISFTINEDVNARVRVDNYRFLSGFAVVKTAPFRLYVLLGLGYYHLEGRVAGNVSGSAEQSLDVPAPLIGVLAQAKLTRFLFELEVSGLSVSYSDVGADYIDVKASVGITLFKVAMVRAGYRYVLINAHVSDFDADMTLDGFFVGAGVQF